MQTSTKAFARAGLLGNPSDGYNGKAISFVIRDYSANVSISNSDPETLAARNVRAISFESLADYVDRVRSQGFDNDGGVCLMQSAVIQFLNYCERVEMPEFQPTRMSFSSNIPREVGLAGSSAIVVATLRGLSNWYDIPIAPEIIASMALAAEHELGISAGLQDRVIQAYEGAVFMDFSCASTREKHGFEFGCYEPIDPSLLSNLYVAFAVGAAESTSVLHNDLRKKYTSGDPVVIRVLGQIAELARQGVAAIESANFEELSRLIDKNFDLRRSICRLNPKHIQLVEVARSCGASAKYCGSGGAIVGMFPDDETWQQLKVSLAKIGCEVLRPRIMESA